MLIAFLELMEGRVRLVEDYRQRGASLSILDTIVNLHVFTFGYRGTRQQQLIDSLAAPRRTIRDSLRRLEECDMICRASSGLYYPTTRTAEVALDRSGGTLREIERLCEAVNAYRCT